MDSNRSAMSGSRGATPVRSLKAAAPVRSATSSASVQSLEMAPALPRPPPPDEGAADEAMAVASVAESGM
jgi:hypothetical protein